MKEREIATSLRDKGFPHITRWEVENNYRRPITATGEPALPPLGALLDEISKIVGLEKMSKDVYFAYQILGFSEYGDANSNQIEEHKQNHSSYRDDHYQHGFAASSPEKAVALLWLALNQGGPAEVQQQPDLSPAPNHTYINN